MMIDELLFDGSLDVQRVEWWVASKWDVFGEVMDLRRKIQD